jgi:two-component system sensor histidine kinase DegS
MTQTDTRTVNPGALTGVRFLVSKRIEELEALGESLERSLNETAASQEAVSRELERLEVRWDAVLRTLPAGDPNIIDSVFRQLAATRANFAAVEERDSDLTTQLVGIRGELEVLRSVYRSLDDLMASSAPPQEGGDRLRSASRQVFQIIEEERMRIARDMHDGPAQSMANLVLQAEILERLIARDPDGVAKELAEFKNGVREVLDETRRLIFDLRPMTLDDLGLVPTLRKFVREFGDRAGVQAQLRVVGEEARLPRALEPTLFRIIQEALNNARKHSRASNVEVAITFGTTRVTAVVRDDGVGMDLPAIEARLDQNRNLGLISMRERTALEKGRLDIRSQPGQGTEVRVSFDL